MNDVTVGPMSVPEAVEWGHDIEIAERGKIAQWRCSCGAGGGSVWYPNAHAALQAARNHDPKAAI